MYTEVDILARCRALTRGRLDRWIDEGWITPHAPSSEKAFNDLDRTRADLICYLIDDLDIQEDAVPLILSLLDQIYGLRGELRTLAEAVTTFPSSVQAEVTVAIQRVRKPNV